jgi:galactonate dehydratase
LKIARVEVFPIRMPRDLNRATGTAGSPSQLGEVAGAYRWSSTVPALYSEFIETSLVKVTLDDGMYGWGESQAPLAPRVSAVIIEDLLGPVIVGTEFDGLRTTIETIWSRMYQSMRVRGQTGGFMLDAISGIDIALWDLAGKIHEKPVARLISDSARVRVPAYLSGVAGDSASNRAEYAAGHAGFDAFKVFFDSSSDSLVELLERLRARLGDSARIAVDALWRLSLPESSSLLRNLEKMGLFWLEAPFQPDEFDPHVELARDYCFPIALGESYRTRWELRPFLKARLLRFVQPDLGRSGITETLRIAAAGAESGSEMVPHVSIALGPQIAAAVHVAASVPTCPMCEYNPSVFATSNRFLCDPLKMDGAAYRLPESPGLGVELRESDLAEWIWRRPMP